MGDPSIALGSSLHVPKWSRGGVAHYFAGAKVCIKYFLVDSNMGKKKKKKCDVCFNSDHAMHECPHVFEECLKGKECKYWCMVDLCTKLHKIIKKFHKASSSRKMERAFEKLDAFERDLESAYDYHENREGRRSRSCSSKKRVARLQKACEALREKYEDEFESDSRESDNDDWFIYPQR